MLFGVHLFPTEYSIQPDELARAIEERGLESLWLSEHTHIPLRFLNSQYGSSLPDYYWKTYDLFVAMTQAATATHKIKIASGVSLVIERDPIHLAKETATLDLISKGRFIFGIGAGWLEAEMADHGVVFSTRFQLLKEKIQATKEIWTNEEAEFHGRFVSFERMRAFPKPYQRPHPPIIMGGSGARSMECAAEFCDGWAPWLMEWPKAGVAMHRIREMAEGHGRDPGSLEFSLFVDPLPDENQLAEMERAGVSRLILTLYALSRENVLPQLDELAKRLRSPGT